MIWKNLRIKEHLSIFKSKGMQGVFITARLGSTRLPDKHLKPVADKPIIQYLLDRIHCAFEEPVSTGEVKIIITTSAEEMNKEFSQFKSLAEVFFGDVNNIPLRHYQAALTHNLDSVIAVDGDDILCSPQAMLEVKNLLKNENDYVTTKGLPFGLNVFGYSVNFLAEALSRNNEEVLETGWGRIFDHKKPAVIRFPGIKERKNSLRFTLDYAEDLQFFREVIEKAGRKITGMTDRELIELVLEKKIHLMNRQRIEEYWQNFHTQKKDYG